MKNASILILAILVLVFGGLAISWHGDLADLRTDYTKLQGEIDKAKEKAQHEDYQNFYDVFGIDAQSGSNIPDYRTKVEAEVQKAKNKVSALAKKNGSIVEGIEMSSNGHPETSDRADLYKFLKAVNPYLTAEVERLKMIAEAVGY